MVDMMAVAVLLVVHGAAGHLVGGHDPGLDILLAQLMLDGEAGERVVPQLPRAVAAAVCSGGGGERRQGRGAGPQHG